MMRSDDDVPEWLSSALRDEAARHEPDRSRIHARVEAGRSPRRARTRPRVLGTSLTAAVAVAAVTVAVWQGFAADHPAPARPLAHSSTSTSPAPPTPSRPTGEGTPMATARSPVPVSSGAASVAPPPSTGRRFLKSSGAVDPNRNEWWTQENVTLRSDRRLVRLRVTVVVARTKGVESTGAWLTLPREDFDLTVREEHKTLVFQFALKQGRAVPAGQYTFAVQYNHAPGGRDGRADVYTAIATTHGGAKAWVRGGF